MNPNRLFCAFLSVALLAVASAARAQSTSSVASITVSNDVTYLGFHSESGSTYALEFATDLTSSNWMQTGGLLVATGGTIAVADPAGAPGFKAYRLVGNPVPRVTLDCVPIGNAGNTNDPGGTGHGAVAYAYEMAETEVSNEEYVRFLNAVDPDGLNTLDLYNSLMATWTEGGIVFDAANPAGAKYEVKHSHTNRPVVFVSFYDAMRFCNWLHNGAAPGGDTEDGAYTLTGGTPTPTNGDTVTRNPGAVFAVPNCDEWYKAAYHQPAGQGGDADDYWAYPTAANAAPTAEAPPGGTNSANYGSMVGTTTEGGAYANAPSFYGTHDQAGNVWEWIEDIPSAGARMIRGGSFLQDDFSLSSSSSLDFTASSEGFSTGFRVAKP